MNFLFWNNLIFTEKLEVYRIPTHLSPSFPISRYHGVCLNQEVNISVLLCLFEITSFLILFLDPGRLTTVIIFII